jgi:DHA2 family multidrug resistance protein
MSAQAATATAPAAGIPFRSKILVVTAVLASLLEIIDTSIVNVSIPTMMGNLGATLDEISWVVTGYIIANAIVLPISGWASQQFGRKEFYTGCIALFTIASVACGLAPNLATLVVFRVIQGLAGGALLPTSQTLITEAFPREKAGMANAIFGMSVMIGPTLGPTLGGYLTDNFGWRSIFNVNLPIGIAVGTLSFLFVEDMVRPAGAASPAAGAPAARKRTPVDWTGLALLIAGIGCLQAVLERGHAEDWFDSGWIVTGAIVAVVSLALLVWWELRVEHPILELRLFRNTNFRYGVMLMAALGALLYTLVFVIPVFTSTILDFTATQTGLLFIPGALMSAAMMPFIGSRLHRSDPRWFIFTGYAGLCVGIFLISYWDAQTSVSGMFWPLLIRGGAMAYLFVPINTVVLSEFSGVAIGQAAGMLNLLRQIGGSVAIAGMSTIFQDLQVRDFAILAAHVTPLDPAAAIAAHATAGAMGSKLQLSVGTGAATVAATKLLYFRVFKQSFVLAFQRTLRLGALLPLLALVPLSRMRRTQSRGPVSAH